MADSRPPRSLRQRLLGALEAELDELERSGVQDAPVNEKGLKCGLSSAETLAQLARVAATASALPEPTSPDAPLPTLSDSELTDSLRKLN